MYIHVGKDGELRLVGETPNSTIGRVEICLEGEWGTICERLWDEYDARVACRQLGLPTEGITQPCIMIIYRVHNYIFKSALPPVNSVCI